MIERLTGVPHSDWIGCAIVLALFLAADDYFYEPKDKQIEQPQWEQPE